MISSAVVGKNIQVCKQKYCQSLVVAVDDTVNMQYPPPRAPLNRTTAIQPPFPSRNPKPDLLENVPWVLIRPVQIRCIQGRFSSLDIGFGGIDPFCFLENLPEEI